jgi:hypothetical protein
MLEGSSSCLSVRASVARGGGIANATTLSRARWLCWEVGEGVGVSSSRVDECFVQTRAWSGRIAMPVSTRRQSAGAQVEPEAKAKSPGFLGRHANIVLYVPNLIGTSPRHRGKTLPTRQRDSRDVIAIHVHPLPSRWWSAWGEGWRLGRATMEGDRERWACSCAAVARSGSLVRALRPYIQS